MKKIFLYVGHSNWGKSEVLKSITDGNHRKRKVDISGKKFWVRKMSNDDYEVGLLEFSKKISSLNYTHFLVAYCPRQAESKRAKEILDNLCSAGELFFFIQRKQYGKNKEISNNEIAYLKDIGSVRILEDEFEFSERAEKFLEFISDNIE